MSTRLFDKGRAALAGASSWTADTIQAMLVNLNTADVAIKAITGATNATPIVITATSHGFANGDLLVIRGVGGNTSANQTCLAANVATNTFEITTLDGQNIVGNGSYTSGGSAINLTLAAATTDVDAGIVGTAVSLTTKTATNGVLDADDVTFSSITGAVDATIIYDSTTSVPLVLVDGKQRVVCAATAASSATTVAVERLAGPIPNGTVLVFSNGISATLTALANAGDRTITVSALSGGITAGHSADCVVTGGGYPFTGGGGSYTNQWDNGANRIAKL